MKSIDDVPDELLKEREIQFEERMGPPRFPLPEADWSFISGVPKGEVKGNSLLALMSAFDLVDGFVDTIATRGRLLLRLGHHEGEACPRCTADLSGQDMCPECRWMSGERKVDEALIITKHIAQAGARIANSANNWAPSRQWIETKTAPLPPGISKKDMKRFDQAYKHWRKDIADRYLRPALKTNDGPLIREVLDTSVIWAQAELQTSKEDAIKFVDVASDRYGNMIAAWQKPLSDILSAERYHKGWVKPTARERARESTLKKLSTKR